MSPERQRIVIVEGAKFGRLIAVQKARQNSRRSWLWLCRCECGGEKEIIGADLIRGHTVSCGCFRKEATATNKTKHGGAKRGNHLREYRIWAGMRNRCRNKNDPAWEYYGAMGVSVCEKWAKDFAVFLADMGPCPEGFSIDRFPDKNGNYEPENCRWASPKEQSNNRRPRRWKKKP